LQSAYSHLERAGIFAMVVNAHFIKHVPGRKTDMCDSEWLALLARFGLVRGSFIPPKDLRELRLVSRYRRKLSAMLASETNRLHKTLDDAGIKLGAVVSDVKLRGAPVTEDWRSHRSWKNNKPSKPPRKSASRLSAILDTGFKKFFGRQANIFCNLTKQNWRHITPCMKWHCCASAIRVTKLLM
jgi:Transposase